MCPCDTGRHTVSHLLFQCPSLAEARAYLPLNNKDINKPGGKSSNSNNNNNNNNNMRPDDTEINRLGNYRMRRPRNNKAKKRDKRKPQQPVIKRKAYPDLTWLLTECADLVSAWAIRHFGIEQFEWTNQHMWFGPSKKYDSLFEGT
ncbi:hypothetical protein LZ30DRAFT_740424 [Colletotrichum cereale]|nr:hypothetical protein LZ30DRAFT_740424 [Colletotrichum cereale]